MSKNEDDAAFNRRLLFRAGHRGFREMDIVLSRFCREQVPAMDRVRREAMARLLELDDRPMFEALCAPRVERQALLEALAPNDSEVQALLLQIAGWVRLNPPVSSGVR